MILGPSTGQSATTSEHDERRRRPQASRAPGARDRAAGRPPLARSCDSAAVSSFQAQEISAYASAMTGIARKMTLHQSLKVAALSAPEHSCSSEARRSSTPAPLHVRQDQQREREAGEHGGEQGRGEGQRQSAFRTADRAIAGPRDCSTATAPSVTRKTVAITRKTLSVVVRSQKSASLSHCGGVLPSGARAALTTTAMPFMRASDPMVASATTRYAQVRTGMSNACQRPKIQREKLVVLLRIPLMPARSRNARNVPQRHLTFGQRRPVALVEVDLPAVSRQPEHQPLHLLAAEPAPSRPRAERRRTARGGGDARTRRRASRTAPAGPSRG